MNNQPTGQRDVKIPIKHNNYMYNMIKHDGHVDMKIIDQNDQLVYPNCKHWPLKHYIDNVTSKQFDTYFKFTLVRNPWERFYSLYNYIKRTAWDRNLYVKNNSFNQWIQLINQHNNTTMVRKLLGYAPGNSATQTVYLSHNLKALDSADMIENLDFVGKVENLETDFKYICEQIGLPETRLNQVNLSNRSTKNKCVWEEYSSIAREIVTNICRDEIEIFQYKFGE